MSAESKFGWVPPLLAAIFAIVAIGGVLFGFMNILTDAINHDTAACRDAGGIPNYVSGEGVDCYSPDGNLIDPYAWRTNQ